MAKDKARAGFRLTEVRSALPINSDPEDKPLSHKIAARMKEAAPDLASRTRPREVQRPAKPIRHVRWADLEELILQPGERHASILKTSEPVLLLVRANWTGNGRTLQLTAEVNGAAHIAGKATRVPPDRGTALLTTEVDSPATVEIATTNPADSKAATLQLVVGMMPLSMRTRG